MHRAEFRSVILSFSCYMLWYWQRNEPCAGQRSGWHFLCCSNVIAAHVSSDRTVMIYVTTDSIGSFSGRYDDVTKCHWLYLAAVYELPCAQALHQHGATPTVSVSAGTLPVNPNLHFYCCLEMESLGGKTGGPHCDTRKRNWVKAVGGGGVVSCRRTENSRT